MYHIVIILTLDTRTSPPYHFLAQDKMLSLPGLVSMRFSPFFYLASLFLLHSRLAFLFWGSKSSYSCSYRGGTTRRHGGVFGVDAHLLLLLLRALWEDEAESASLLGVLSSKGWSRWLILMAFLQQRMYGYLEMNQKCHVSPPISLLG
jgi:hypothetical protein